VATSSRFLASALRPASLLAAGIGADEGRAEQAPRMGDVLERKGYYNELVLVFETIRQKLAICEQELRDDMETKLTIEEEIDGLKRELMALRRTMAESRRTKRTNDYFLQELEAGGVRAAIAHFKLKYASVPVPKRAQTLRRDFRQVAREGAASPLAKHKMGSSADCHHQGVKVKDFTFDGPAENKVPVRCYSGAEGPRPVVVFFHGEGYVTGDYDTHEWMCRSLAALARVTIVTVDYRRAPEHKFPAAFEDAYAAVCWVAEGGMGDAPPSLAVAGDSNGAAMAMACCLKARDHTGEEPGPEIQVQTLFYPWMDLRPDSPAMQAEDTDVEFLAGMDWNRSVYAPPFTDPPEDSDEESSPEPAHPLGEDGRPWFEDWRASPLLAESLADLPPAFIAYASDDPLAEESVRLADRLRSECGPEAVHTLHLQGPLGHGFAKQSEKPQAHAAVSAAAAFLSASLRAPMSPTRSPVRRGGGGD